MRIIHSNGYIRLIRHSQEGAAEFGQAMQGLGNAGKSLQSVAGSLTSFFTNFNTKYPQWRNQYGKGISFKRLVNGDPAQAVVVLQSIINSPQIDQQTRNEAQKMLNRIQSTPALPTPSSSLPVSV